VKRFCNITVWSTPASGKWATPFNTAITTLKERPWSLETPDFPSLAGIQGHQLTFGVGFFVYLFGFRFFTACLQAPAGPEANPSLSCHLTPLLEAHEDSPRGGWVEIPPCPCNLLNSPCGQGWLDCTQAPTPQPSFPPFFQRKESPCRMGQWKQQHRSKHCHLEHNRCRKWRFITRLPEHAIYLPVPCPRHILLPRNHTLVVDPHNITINIGILRWIAAKTASWKLQP